MSSDTRLVRIGVTLALVLALCAAPGVAGTPLSKHDARVLATSLTLTAEDMPEYQAIAHVFPAEAKRAQKKFLDCAHALQQKLALADVNSDDYTFGGRGGVGAGSVTSRVVVMPNRTSAMRDLRAVNSKRGQACLKKMNNGVLVTDDAKVLSVTTTKLAPQVRGTAVTRTVVRISGGDRTADLVFDGISYRRGAVEISLGAIAVNEPFDSTEEQRLAQLLVTRAQQALPAP